MKKDSNTTEEAQTVAADPLIEKTNGYLRRKLPDDRPAFTHKFNVGGHEGYLNVGFYPDTMKPGETFITVAKEGSTFSGLLDTIATLISVSLQSGVPLKVLVKKFKDMRFDPSGFTENPDIPTAKSIVDYVFRYLGMKYLSKNDREEIFGSEFATMPDFAERVLEVKNKTDSLLAGLVADAPNPSVDVVVEALPAQAGIAPEHHQPGMVSRSSADAPVCTCGTLMVKAGACYSCPNCFATTGVCS